MVIALLAGFYLWLAPMVPAKAEGTRLAAGYGRLPLSFESNQGQTGGQARFLARSGGQAVFLDGSGAALVLRKGSAASVVRTKLIGSRKPAAVEGIERLPGTSNYFRGNEPAKWKTGIPNYRRVRYRAVYPGIDLVFYGDRNNLEYDFVIAPGADPKRIRVQFEGVESIRADAGGDLVLQLAGGELRQRAPAIYQETERGRRPIVGRYRLRGANEVEFEVGPYDIRRPLVIDPVLSYSTYLGGSGDDYIYAITADSSGNAYVAGSTTSFDFPPPSLIQLARAGTTDVFVAKLDPTGKNLVYATYLGGSGTQTAYGIAVDASGSAYVTGETSAHNFSTKAGAYIGSLPQSVSSGAFIAKLNAAGSGLVYSTLLCGSSGATSARAIAVDASGLAYVTGTVSDTSFPTTAGVFQRNNKGEGDAFVTKLNASGSGLIYSTFLGGTGADTALGIAIDPAGEAYVTGYTTSTDFPLQNAIQTSNRGSPSDNAFVTKLNATGTGLLYSTYLGSNILSAGNAIAVDAGGNAYVTGETWGTGFPLKNPIQQSYGGSIDAFVTKISPDGSNLVYSTYLGGSSRDTGYGIAVDGAGNAYVTGYTYSQDFPVANAVQPYPGLDGLTYKSIDGGDTWSQLRLPAAAGPIDAMAIAPGSPSTVYAGDSWGGVFKTADGGASWTSCSAGLTGSPVYALVLASNGALYAGTSDGVFKSVNGGGSWTLKSTGFLSVLAIATAPGDSNVLYAAGVSGNTGTIYKSSDAGDSWAPVQTNTSTYYTALVVHPDDPLTVFAGTLDGNVYASSNGGGTWGNTYLPAPSSGTQGWPRVNALAIGCTPASTCPPARTLYAATSAWYFARIQISPAPTPGYWGKLASDSSCSPLGSCVFTAGLALAPNPSVPGTVYEGTSNGFYRGTNGNTPGLVTGGPGNWTAALAIDPINSNTIYAGGRTAANFDAFVTVLNPQGTGIVYSTYLGGSADDAGRAIAVDAAGNAYVAGDTLSTDFPTVNAHQPSAKGGRDGFAVRLGAPACTYSLVPTAAAWPSGASANHQVNVTASDASCGWGATSAADWLVITSGQSGTGNGAVTYQVSANGGTSRSGTLTIAGLSFTVTQAANQAPAALAMSPGAGNGFSQVLTFTFSDPDGWQDLDVVDILINNFLDGRQACYLAYVVPSSSLALVDDAGEAGGPYAGSQNSQCAVSLVSATGSGGTLTLTLNITFKPGFGGNKIVYLAARDSVQNNTGWQALGVWQVPFTPGGTISAGSLSPARGASASGTPQSFTLTLTDSLGAADIGIVNLLVNNFIDGRQACYLAYVASSNTLLLVDDAGHAEGPYARMALNGGGGPIQNSQCAVSGAGSSAVLAGNTLTLTLNVTFQAGFSGNRIFYAAGRDNAGGNNTGWQALGTITVAGPP